MKTLWCVVGAVLVVWAVLLCVGLAAALWCIRAMSREEDEGV